MGNKAFIAVGLIGGWVAAWKAAQDTFSLLSDPSGCLKELTTFPASCNRSPLHQVIGDHQALKFHFYFWCMKIIHFQSNRANFSIRFWELQQLFLFYDV